MVDGRECCAGVQMPACFGGFFLREKMLLLQGLGFRVFWEVRNLLCNHKDFVECFRLRWEPCASTGDTMARRTSMRTAPRPMTDFRCLGLEVLWVGALRFGLFCSWVLGLWRVQGFRWDCCQSAWYMRFLERPPWIPRFLYALGDGVSQH